eukprot:5461706-Pleurochrysis_carterae.AAC.1
MKLVSPNDESASRGSWHPRTGQGTELFKIDVRYIKQLQLRPTDCGLTSEGHRAYEFKEDEIRACDEALQKSLEKIPLSPLPNAM